MAASRRTGSSHGTAGTGQSRQLPGSACEECRKRKLRCDRQRPQCGTCVDAGIACEVNHNRLARGPKKGDLKALRSRIVALERRLSIDHSSDALTILAGEPAATPTAEPVVASSASEGRSPTLVSPCQNQSSWDGEIHVQVSPVTPTSAPLNFSTFQFPPTPPSPPRSTFVDDLMRADLDQLYFDRVHPNLPIFNHSRYFARSRRNPSTDGPSYMLCLQYAMWTLAMALSSQFESSRELLYTETRQMLEALDLVDDDLQPVRIEQVQSWLLVTFYELSRASYRRASISAGRAFRLVQLARLHDIDAPGNIVAEKDEVAKEERRRTFWAAYCLDRLICMRSRGPLTLTEEVMCIRLPSPDLAFQSGHPIPGCFLPEAMASGDQSFLSPLAESAIVLTICGRALSHAFVSSMELGFGSAPLDFWLRHEWLDGMLSRTFESLSTNARVVSAVTDPMVLFVLMMAHTTTIFMWKIVEAFGTNGQCRSTVAEYQQRATRAAREIASLANAYEHIGYFKAHIFLPLTVSLAASHLLADCKRGVDAYYHQASDGAIGPISDGDIQSCIEALRKTQSFNYLARDHLAVFESQEFVFGGL